MIVYVARGDLSLESRLKPRNHTVVAGPRFPRPIHHKPDQKNKVEYARKILSGLFEDNSPTVAILLFSYKGDAERRASIWYPGDKRILEVNLVGNLYRELDAYVRDAQYFGALPRIDGNAFLIFGPLAEYPETKEEKKKRIMEQNLEIARRQVKDLEAGINMAANQRGTAGANLGKKRT